MQTESPIIPIALDKLRASALNARRRRATESLEDLAASILAEGLLQNLTVTEGDGGGFEIVAGMRRFGALQILRDRGQLPRELELVPCRVVHNGRASSASLAENVVRKAMHAADEFRAFKQLADEGRSVEAIAQEFGVVPLVVERRLRLANVAPSLFELFSDDKISLDQMTALAVTDDHAAQVKAWNSAKEWDREPHALRQRLTKGEIDIDNDAVARFVGADALEKAGAVVRRDLFSESGGGFTTDRALIDELALKRLEKIADEIRASEKWKWIEARKTFDMYGHSGASGGGYFTKLQAEPGRIAKADREQMTALSEELNSLGDDNGHFTEAQDRRGEEIETELELIKARGETWTDAQREAAGVVVTIQHGKLNIIRGLVRPNDKKPRAASSSSSSTGASESAPKKKPDDVSETMLRRLTAQRTAILQGAVMVNPTLGIRVLAHRLILDAFYRERMQSSTSRIEFEGPGALEAHASELPMMSHTAATSERVAAIKAALPPATNLFAWLLSAADGVVIELLVVAAALSIDTVAGPHTPKNDAAAVAELVAAAGVDFADHWEPTRETFLSHVPRSVIEQAIREACGEVEVGKLATLKKEQLVDAAEQLLAGKRWLPKVLRAPKAKASAEVKAPPAKRAKPKASAPAKKAAAKKPAPKKAAKKAAKKRSAK